MEKSENLKSELPESVLSYIFSKLSIKDLVKTSLLSKQWLYEWGSRMDLNFDLQSMFDYNTIQELPESLPLFKGLQSEFSTRLDQFMLHYQGAKIRSLRVNFPLDDEHSDVIGRLISKGIAKGAERIELLFSYKTSVTGLTLKKKQCKISFTLLSDSDSLTYLHLENCLLVAPMEFSGLKNLRTLVLHLVAVDKDLLLGLFSNCVHLLDLTLYDCKFNSDLNIISPTLGHLNIVDDSGRGRRRNIDIFAPKLSSFEYFIWNRGGHTINIDATKLSKFSYNATLMSTRIGFSRLKNVTTIVLDGVREPMDLFTPHLFSECLQLEDVTFKNCTLVSEMKIISLKLRHLNIIDCGFRRFHPPKIDIDALNLSSFDFSGHMMISSIKAPKLLKVFWNEIIYSKKNRKGKETKIEVKPCRFDLIASFHQLESLAVTMSHSQIAILPRVLGPFQNLRQLELFIEGANDSDMDYFWILDIAMVSLYLQKLSLTIRNSLKNSHMEFQRQRREYAGFSHNELKYVELRGCVDTINVIELASHLLRNANSLKQITFSSRNRFYTGAGRWTEGSDSCGWFERDLIRDMLKDEVNGQCQLIIL